MKIQGYGIAGAGEADRRMEATLKEFKRLCDTTTICLNNTGKKERDLIKKYGFNIVEDNREWGKDQWKIKQNFFNSLKPADAYVCLDMDEIFVNFNRKDAEELVEQGGVGYYFYIVNLIDKGYSEDFSFFNIRFWINGDFSKEWEHKNLHCGLAPKIVYQWANYAPYIVEHYGLKDKADRDRKIKRYNKYDKDARWVGKQYYDFLASKQRPDDYKQKQIIKEIEDYVKDTNFKEYNKYMNKEKEYYYIKLKDGRIVDIPAYALDEELARGSVLISDKAINKNGKKVESTSVEDTVNKAENELECPVCGFVAKTKAGLKVHSRKHD